MKSTLLEILGADFPLVQAGMGGVAGIELASAVSNAGCAGTLGLYRCPSAHIPELLRATLDRTSAPVAVNFVPEVVSEEWLTEQVRAVLGFAPANTYFSFFGIPPRPLCDALHDAHRVNVVQVGTPVQAERAAQFGADALILQGIESGGHHLGNCTAAELLARTRDRLRDVPLLVAGGVSSGSDLARLERLGADGCVCGTLFAASAESAAHPRYKACITRAHAADTVITDVFSVGWPGRSHRVLRNRTVQQQGRLPANFLGVTRAYGQMHVVPRYSAAVPTVETTGPVEEMALYCGTSCEGINAVRPVVDIIAGFRHAYRRATVNAEC